MVARVAVALASVAAAAADAAVASADAADVETATHSKGQRNERCWRLLSDSERNHWLADRACLSSTWTAQKVVVVTVARQPCFAAEA